MVDRLADEGITEEDLLRLGSEMRFELINGEVVKMSPVGIEHAIIAENVYRILYAFVAAHQLGYVFASDLIFILKRDKAKRVRKTCVPDVAFIRKGRIPKGYNLKRPFPGAPDLAVEVMSPKDRVGVMQAKIAAYFEAGAEQVWVLFPDQQTLHQYRREDAKIIRIYQNDDVIDTETLFPGLKLVTSDLFVMPDFGSP